MWPPRGRSGSLPGGEKMRGTIAFMAVLLGAVPAAAETVVVEAGRDATLIEHPDGSLANGSGPALFVGRTAQAENSIRRALIRFDVDRALPEQAIVESVSLTLSVTPSNPRPLPIHVHRVLADWGEGPSSSSGGGGAAALPGDVTWLHTFWDTDLWVHPGGQFLGRSSALQEVASAGFCTWAGTEHLVQDVRLWKAAPELNFGWILIGDETTAQTAKSFASREHPDSASRPVLVIGYRLPGDPPGR